jgi:hypothetical protein
MMGGYIPMEGIDTYADPEDGINIEHATSSAQDGVWSERRDYSKECHSDSEDEGGSDEDQNSSDGGDREDSQSDLGLSAVDLLGEEFEADAIANGIFFWELVNHFSYHLISWQLESSRYGDFAGLRFQD